MVVELEEEEEEKEEILTAEEEEEEEAFMAEMTSPSPSSPSVCAAKGGVRMCGKSGDMPADDDDDNNNDDDDEVGNVMADVSVIFVAA